MPAARPAFRSATSSPASQGPCPKCKAIIKVPAKSEQVVIHEPETTIGGKKSVTGQPDFKPIAWKETRLTTPQIVAIGGGVLFVLLAALIIRIASGDTPVKPIPLLALGALLLAPPLAFAGYAFLRDTELEPHRGKDLILRLIAPSIVYPALWGLYWFAFWYLERSAELVHVVIVAPVVIGIGAFTAQMSLDLDFGAGALHYSLYLFATLLLRLIVGLSPHWHVEPVSSDAVAYFVLWTAYWL